MKFEFDEMNSTSVTVVDDDHLRRVLPAKGLQSYKKISALLTARITVFRGDFPGFFRITNVLVVELGVSKCTEALRSESFVPPITVLNNSDSVEA